MARYSYIVLDRIDPAAPRVRAFRASAARHDRVRASTTTPSSRVPPASTRSPTLPTSTSSWGVFRPIRHALGSSAFGINQIDFGPGHIGAEHDESDFRPGGDL